MQINHLSKGQKFLANSIRLYKWNFAFAYNLIDMRVADCVGFDEGTVHFTVDHCEFSCLYLILSHDCYDIDLFLDSSSMEWAASMVGFNLLQFPWYNNSFKESIKC